MIVVDNFLEHILANNIETVLSSNKFPWFYLNQSLPLPDVDGYVNTPVFRHAFVYDHKQNSENIRLVNPLIDSLKNLFNADLELSSVIGNLLVPNTGLIGEYIIPHYDVNYDSKVYETYKTYTALYYVNECDGDTILFNERHEVNKQPVMFTEYKRVSPKKNRLIYWDSKIYHSAPASASKTRIVINFNFLIKGSVAEPGLLR